MLNISLSYPYLLLLLLLLPCFLYCKIEPRRIYFSKPEWLPTQGVLWSKEPWWLMLIYLLVVMALSQPYRHLPLSSLEKKGRDLVLILDTSGSMAERGFDPKDPKVRRYDATVALAKAFLKERHDDNLGLVVFGSFAFTASPLTYDLKALVEMFDLMSDVGIAGSSTAIGEALMQGITTLEQGEAKSKVLILLTDGVHNAGATSPHQAVRLAQEKGIKIYTIGIGQAHQHDKVLLQRIADETNGRYFSAQDAQALRLVYEQLDGLEPSPIRSGEALNREALFWYPLMVATLLLGLFNFREELA